MCSISKEKKQDMRVIIAYTYKRKQEKDKKRVEGVYCWKYCGSCERRATKAAQRRNVNSSLLLIAQLLFV